MPDRGRNGSILSRTTELPASEDRKHYGWEDKIYIVFGRLTRKLRENDRKDGGMGGAARRL